MLKRLKLWWRKRQNAKRIRRINRLVYLSDDGRITPTTEAGANPPIGTAMSDSVRNEDGTHTVMVQIGGTNAPKA